MSLFGQDISGDWSGKLEVGEYQLGLFFKISKDSLGYSCLMSIPQQDKYDIKIQHINLMDSTLTIRQPDINFEFNGKLGGNSKVQGELKQNGLFIPLVLKREQISFRRPQTPRTPLNYFVEDIVFTNPNDNVFLTGTLTTPKNLDTYPILIIIGGSGPQNKDGEILGHKPFLVIADHLSNRGIGVLRFDERGIGKSSGLYDTTSIEGFTSDVIAAVDYIKSRKNLNVKSFGLMGHSLGGIIAAKVASVREDINFVIFLATPAISGKELMLKQKASIEEKTGISKQQIELSGQIFSGAYDILINSEEKDSLRNNISSYFNTNLGPLTSQRHINKIVNQITSTEFKDFLKLHPFEYLSQVTCPVLALYGSKDLQVDSEVNLKAMENALLSGGNHKVKIEEIKGLNHLFQECQTGLPNEYFEIEQTIAPQVLEEITKWIVELN
tara:strand:+ start:1582 stop:2901 length:1320 start_codon:yes stop_codon:yes gene_type:complete